MNLHTKQSTPFIFCVFQLYHHTYEWKKKRCSLFIYSVSWFYLHDGVAWIHSHYTLPDIWFAKAFAICIRVSVVVVVVVFSVIYECEYLCIFFIFIFCYYCCCFQLAHILADEFSVRQFRTNVTKLSSLRATAGNRQMMSTHTHHLC